MSTHNIWFHISPLIWSFVHIVQVTLSDNGICYICIYLTVSNDSGNKSLDHTVRMPMLSAYGLRHVKTCLRAYADSESADQRSLIRAFTFQVYYKKNMSTFWLKKVPYLTEAFKVIDKAQRESTLSCKFFLAFPRATTPPEDKLLPWYRNPVSQGTTVITLNIGADRPEHWGRQA